MKKVLFTLNVNDYSSEITDLTYPLLKRYAHKIGAEFYVIQERKHPEMPPVYEKLQIYQLAQELGTDWNIYIDSDALVHPDFFDPTELVHKDTVLHNATDFANNRWKYDNIFRRDGRHIGSCNWFTIASDWCIDLWCPLDVSYEYALDHIFPIQDELNSVVTREHLIDDYTLSRNIARFGLKVDTVMGMMTRGGISGNYLWHQYTMPVDEKVVAMKEILEGWRVNGN